MISYKDPMKLLKSYGKDGGWGNGWGNGWDNGWGNGWGSRWASWRNYGKIKLQVEQLIVDNI